MRADNSHHVIVAARRRAEITRKRAVSALRRMDKAGLPITFDAVAREAQVSRSWLYNQPDLRAEVERLRSRRTHPHQGGRFPTGNAPRTLPCCGGWSPRPSASEIWKQTTSNSARRSPWPSGSVVPATFAAAPATRRGRNPPRSPDPPDDHVGDTVLIETLLLRAMIVSLAQDKACGSAVHAAVVGVRPRRGRRGAAGRGGPAGGATPG